MSLEDYPLPTQRLFEPTGRFEEPGLPDTDTTAIVMGNHLGGSVNGCDGEPGDAGRKAQAVADRTGYRVLAYDRPGTGPEDTAVTITPDNYDESSRWVAGALFRSLHTEGIDKVILAGNSAGATCAIGLACHPDVLPVTHLITMDPMGTEKHHLDGGLLQWLAVGLKERRLPRPEPTIDERQDEAADFNFRQFLRDARQHHELWRSDEASIRLRILAQRCGNITMRTVWPRQTFSASPEALERLSTELPALRQANSDTTQPVEAFIEDGNHAQYGNFRVFANHVAKALKPEFPGFDF